jgi:hypothetical protein
MNNKKIGVRVYLILSAIAGAVVGLVWYGGVRKVDESLLAGGITFIVFLVVIATLTLMVKDDTNDPNEPRLK